MKIKLSINGITTLLLSVFMVITFFPVFSTEVSCVVMLIIIMVGVLSYQFDTINALIGMLTFIAVLVLYYFIGKGLVFNSNGLIYYILFLISSFFSYSLVKKLSEKQVKFLIFILVILMLYVSISTIFISIINPKAVRSLGYGDLASDVFLNSMRQQGLIMYSYGVGEAMAIISPVLLAYSLKNENKIISFFCYGTIILCIFSQMMAALTTSFILIVLFCGLTIVTYMNTVQASKKIKIVFIVIFALILSAPYLGDAFVNNSLLSNRLVSIQSMLAGNTNAGGASIRMQLLLRSVREWLASPILGLADVGGLGIESGVSMHTAIFDYLGLYGLFSLLFFGSWISIIKKQYKDLSIETRKYYKWGIVSLVLLLMLKGPVTITTNYYFSVVLVEILIAGEKYKQPAADTAF